MFMNDVFVWQFYLLYTGESYRDLDLLRGILDLIGDSSSIFVSIATLFNNFSFSNTSPWFLFYVAWFSYLSLL